MTGDDSSEESDCGTDRSSIFDGLVADLRQESSSWMGDFAGSSWRQGKSANNGPDTGAGVEKAMTAGLGPETDGLGAGSCLSSRPTTVRTVYADIFCSWLTDSWLLFLTLS